MGEHDDLLKKLQSKDVELEREAAFAAGELRVLEAVPQLAILVQSQNLGVQEAADQALRRIDLRPASSTARYLGTTNSQQTASQQVVSRR